VRLAREVLGLARRALAPDTPIEVALAADVRAERTTAVRVVVAGPDAAARLLWPLSPDTMAEAYLRGDIDIEGDIWAAIDAGRTFDPRRLGLDMARLARLGLRLRRGVARPPPLRRVARLSGRLHSRARDLAAVRFHYDVGTLFFALWLDRRLTYSCAYFETPETSLHDAQEAKLELICRKLALAPGQRLFDIGAGWGSLVVYAAERHGVEAVGVTLSEPQASHANERAAEVGVGERVRVDVRDYRDLAPLRTFDAVASVGMFEHVGRANLPAYFRAAWEALRPGGLFLNHGIATTATPRARRLPRPRFGTDGFVGRYVFPDGELVTVEEAIGVARRVGFELLHGQSLRPHYALTLRAWVERLEARAREARALVNEEVFRTWRLYMAAARRGFEDGSLDVVQLLLARPAASGPAALPLRPWWP
jgi:cyclopropane-fatty-acyl-phospholipid synthase